MVKIIMFDSRRRKTNKPYRNSWGIGGRRGEVLYLGLKIREMPRMKWKDGFVGGSKESECQKCDIFCGN